MEIKKIVTNPIAENCYVVSDDKGTGVIVDPGADCEKISMYLTQNGINPVAILLTHGHFDHVGAVNKLKNMYNLKIYANINERGTLSDPAKIYVFGGGDGKGIDVDVWLEDGDTVTAGTMEFKVIHTPGHTIGSCCYLIEKHLLSGDTLFLESIGRCDLEGGSFSAIENSIKTKLYTLDEDVIVHPGHGGGTTIGDERRFNPFVTGDSE